MLVSDAPVTDLYFSNATTVSIDDNILSYYQLLIICIHIVYNVPKYLILP